MSLAGLDSESVKKAYETTVADPTGWFLLHYTTRAEVALLKKGTGGFAETREAIADYGEPSPLFGLVLYRRKKVLLKYVPEDTSRLLQARLSVHLQSVIESFAHDALLSLTTASDLTETALSSSVSALKASGSIKSTSGRKHKLLSEILEDGSESNAPHQAVTEVAETDKVEDTIGRSETQRSSEGSTLQVVSADTIVKPPCTTSLDNSRATSTERPSTAVPTKRAQEEDRLAQRPSLDERRSITESSSSPRKPYVPYAYKPKVKLGPRPSIDAGQASRKSGSFSRPISTLPAGVTMPQRKQLAYERPSSHQAASKPFFPEGARITEMSSSASMMSPMSERPDSSHGSINTVPAYTHYPEPSSPTIPSVSLEKQRLMKALQQRRKNQQARKASVETDPADANPSPPIKEEPFEPSQDSASDTNGADRMVNEVNMKAKSTPHNASSRDTENVDPGVATNGKVVESAAIKTSTPHIVANSDLQELKRSNVSELAIKDETVDGTDLEASYALQKADVPQLAKIEETVIKEEASINGGLDPSVNGNDKSDSETMVSIRTAKVAGQSEDVDGMRTGKGLKSSEKYIAQTEEATADDGKLRDTAYHIASEAPLNPEIAQLDNSAEREPHSDAGDENVAASLPSMIKEEPVGDSAESPTAPTITPGDILEEDKAPSTNQLKKESSTSSVNRKKRPDPIEPPVFDSSDAGSISGDSFMEELRSATVEEATPMIVSRSPATPVFPLSRRSSETSKLGRTVTSPTDSDAPPLPAISPELKKTMSDSASFRLASDSQSIRSVSNPIDALPAMPRDKGLSHGSVSRFTSRASSVSPSPEKASVDRQSSKKTGVSSLISSRIKALEKLSTSGSQQNLTTAVVTPSLVSKRKTSLSTPPSSAGTDMSRQRESRPYPTPSPSPHNFVARTFGSRKAPSPAPAPAPAPASQPTEPNFKPGIFVTTTQARQRPQRPTLERSQESEVSLNESLLSSAPSVQTEPPSNSYFSRPTKKTKSKKGSVSSISSAVLETLSPSRNSFSSRRSTASRRSSNDTIRQPVSPFTPGSGSETKSKGSSEKKESKKSRLLRRMSSMSFSPRKNTTLNPTLNDQPIVEGTEPESSKKWSPMVLGDVNVQFPDTLLWKRRHFEIDSHGYLIVAPSKTERNSRITTKRYHISEFRVPYAPDQDREELPFSVILDFHDNSTLQCACEHSQGQLEVLKILVECHTAFSPKGGR
ncbi:MAG: hypothetical protein MMC23_003488 [Stictis urceolatum]|nr:hypothetical protein [Stictis urceolata]